MSTILWSFGNWSKLEKWKSLIGGCLISWPQIKNIIVLKCVVFSYSVQQQCTTSQLHFDMQWKVDCIRQLVSQTCTQMRVMVTVWWSAAHLIHYSFLNPSETITSKKYAQQINEMHKKLQCLQLALINRKDPILLHDNAQPQSHNQYSKRWTQWATEFCLICHIHLTSHQLTTTSSSIWTTFCSENASTTSWRQKMFSKSSLNSKACIFML